MNRLNLLFHRPDFRRNPAAALWRRFVWKARWLTTTQPCRVTLGSGIKMALLKGGAGALIFYHGTINLNATKDESWLRQTRDYS